MTAPLCLTGNQAWPQHVFRGASWTCQRCGWTMPPLPLLPDSEQVRDALERARQEDDKRRARVPHNPSGGRKA